VPWCGILLLMLVIIWLLAAAMTASCPARDTAAQGPQATVYSRRQLLGLWSAQGSKSTSFIHELGAHGLLRYRGKRAGRAGARPSHRQSDPGEIPTITSNRYVNNHGDRCDHQHRHDTSDRRPVRIRVHIDRHCVLPRSPPSLVFSCLNVRSLNSKLNDLLEVRHDHCIDVLLLTETWHDDDSVCIRRLRADGYTVVERARPRLAAASPLAVNHGGVAAVAVPGVHLTIVNTGPQPTTFESVCARVTSASTSCIVLLIYRPGSVATSSLFFDELAAILDNLVTLPTPLVVAGDINVRLDRPDDPAARQLMSLLAEHGLSCRVNSPTHTAGGLLDIVASTDCRCD